MCTSSNKEEILRLKKQLSTALDLLGRKAMGLATPAPQSGGLDVERLATVLRTLWPCLCEAKLVERANYHSPDCTHADPDADADDIARAYADAGRDGE